MKKTIQITNTKPFEEIINVISEKKSSINSEPERVQEKVPIECTQKETASSKLKEVIYGRWESF